jgi:hypothetical protein
MHNLILRSEQRERLEGWQLAPELFSGLATAFPYEAAFGTARLQPLATLSERLR